MTQPDHTFSAGRPDVHATTTSTAVAGLGDVPTARIGAALGAQRVEVYRRIRDDARLVSWWADPRFVVVPPDLGVAVPVDWFPWTLGNIRRARHVLVRNAGSLPLRPGLAATIGDLGMVSALHLPIPRGIHTAGTVCAYWSTEQTEWDATAIDHLIELAFDVLNPGAGPRQPEAL